MHRKLLIFFDFSIDSLSLAGNIIAQLNELFVWITQLSIIHYNIYLKATVIFNLHAHFTIGTLFLSLCF